jgi:hypothetical protein
MYSSTCQVVTGSTHTRVLLDNPNSNGCCRPAARLSNTRQQPVGLKIKSWGTDRQKEKGAGEGGIEAPPKQYKG